MATGAVAFAPLAWLAIRFLRGDTGANPIELLLNQTGFWALVVLLASLACTPLKLVLGWRWPLQVRRLLGVSAFVYGALHLSTYLVLDQFFDWGAIWEDVSKRPFITVGVLAFVLLVPLAVTSTNKMVKRLGFPRWKRLHRLVYVATAAAVVHFVWRVKADLREPAICGAVLAFLLGIRVWAWARDRRHAGAASPSS